MKKLIFARYVNRLFLASLGIVVVSPVSAGAAQASSSNSVYQPSYAPRPPSEVAAPESYQSGNYTPPTYSAGSSATPRDARFAISKPRGPSSTATSGKLETKVAQLAKNDQRQDQRLRHLERDVTSLKTGGDTSKTSRQDYATSSNAVHLHTVRAGETLWGIAAKYNTSVNAVRTANRMSNDTVVAGQALAIPVEGAATGGSSSSSVQAYTVRPGDTFSQIARIYGISIESLQRANPKTRPERLLVGTTLTVPGKQGVATQPVVTEKALPTPAPAKGGTHTVSPGESLGAIAKRYGIPTADLAALNKLKNPDLVEVGQQLILPQDLSSTASPTPTTLEPAALSAVETTIEEPAAKTPDTSLASLTLAPASLAPALEADLTMPEVAPPAPRNTQMPVGTHRGVVAYRLERGDDLTTVANMFGTTPEKLREMNHLNADAVLKEGDEVVVPALGPVSLN